MIRWRKFGSVVLGALPLVSALSVAPPAWANGFGTDVPWAFQTSTDMANLAAVQSLIQEKKGGFFHSPSYNTYNNTTIGKQTNCNVAPTTYGNYGVGSATAGSPSTSGAAANATGNASSATSNLTDANSGTGLPLNSTGQTNTGSVASNLNGSTNVSTSGTYSQALNSTQSNGGTQTASVSNSSACSF
jgi:hypothetical protein